MPKDSRRELDLLRDDAGPLGCLFWRIVSDLLLWSGCLPESRGNLFRSLPVDADEPLAREALAAPGLGEPLKVLLAVSATPERAEAGSVAEACAAVAEWAEGRDMKEAAVQFAEMAARVEPEVSRRAYTPGRLCRRIGAHRRAALWYTRAARLARRARRLGVKGSEVDFANALLGLGNLELDLGRFEKAERHYRKAIRASLRVGRKSLAGAGHHNLLALMIASHRLEEAGEHAHQAVALYPAGHPRFPALAHDVALLWLNHGYFSSALPVFEKVLPWVERQRERILALACLARCAGAVKDHIRFERAAAEVLKLAATDNELADSSLYQVAEGARSFQAWERAEALATRALELAEARRNQPVAALAHSLLDALSTHQTGDTDRVPEADGEIDRSFAVILRKLRSQPAPDLASGASRPENYPSE